jgi:hypothetical protein
MWLRDGQWELGNETATTWTKLINRNTVFQKAVSSGAVMIELALDGAEALRPERPVLYAPHAGMFWSQHSGSAEGFSRHTIAWVSDCTPSSRVTERRQFGRAVPAHRSPFGINRESRSVRYGGFDSESDRTDPLIGHVVLKTIVDGDLTCKNNLSDGFICSGGGFFLQQAASWAAAR